MTLLYMEYLNNIIHNRLKKALNLLFLILLTQLKVLYLQLKMVILDIQLWVDFLLDNIFSMALIYKTVQKRKMIGLD